MRGARDQHHQRRRRVRSRLQSQVSTSYKFQYGSREESPETRGEGGKPALYPRTIFELRSGNAREKEKETLRAVGELRWLG